MAKNRIGGIGDGDSDNRWSKYQDYLDHLDRMDKLQGLKPTPMQVTLSEGELKVGTPAFKKLQALSDQLGEMAEKDFMAKQLKMEIDRALQAAQDSGGGGWLKAFAVGKKRDVEE